MDQFKVALVGNPNCGKTTLFNHLTGSNHYVGNWAGVTVEQKIGKVSFENHLVEVVDLPGIYSLSPYSLEEKISRNYLLEDEADLVLNIVDSSYLERNLYLTLQLIEMGKPVVLALNMMDEAKKKHIQIDIEKMSDTLGIPVVPISALKKQGIRELLVAVVEAHHHRREYRPKQQPFDQTVEALIEKTERSLESCEHIRAPKRWVAMKVIEKDEDISALIQMKAPLEQTNGEAIISEARYAKISEIIDATVDMSAAKQDRLTQNLDQILLNKVLGLPIFGFIMWIMFFLTFNIGGYFADWIDVFFSTFLGPAVASLLDLLGVMAWMQSLIVDGIIGGVGGILTFVPNIAILFVLISILEDSGYMARVAYLMDFWMSRAGLNGKSFIPMILGFGCNVPAIMSTRTVENENDRLITILVNPFMSCGARFPVYVIFAGAFFPGNETLITFSLYLLGIVVALMCAFVFRRTLFKGEEALFIMEFPPFRLPGLKSLGIHVWERVQGYLTKAGTVILGASILLWLLLNFNLSGMTDVTHSFGAGIGGVIAPIFTPLGFGNWQAALSLLTGVVAKEIIVANMMIVYGLADTATTADFAQMMGQTFSQLSAYAFMVFVLLYTPCVGVIGVIKRETNSWKWTIFSIVYQFCVAWLVAFIVYQVGRLLGFM